MIFPAMLTDAFQDCDAGFPIRCRFDGKVLNLRRLQANTKVQTDVLIKLLYADEAFHFREVNARGYGSSFASMWQL